MSESIQLVRMTRDIPAVPNGPTTADVHPDEIAEYEFAGWTIDNSGPTFEEFVDAGYKPENYPPHGYEAKITPGYIQFLQQVEASKRSESSSDAQRDGVITGDRTETTATRTETTARGRRQQN